MGGKEESSATEGVFRESPLTFDCGSFADREVLLLACGVVCGGVGEEVFLRDGDDTVGQSCEFDAKWDSDEADDESEEEEEEEDGEDEEDTNNTTRTSLSTSLNTSTNVMMSSAADGGFKILSLETELGLLRKKFSNKEQQMRDVAGEKEKAERDAYNAQMNNTTLQSELASAHERIRGMEEKCEELRKEVERQSSVEAKNEKLKKDVKAVGNEKAVLSARIQSLENKLQSLTEMQDAARKNEKALQRAGVVEKQLNVASEKVSRAHTHTPLT